ncbi:ABC transporter permease [Cellulomonas carbonis]|uniref:ABC transporter permease n=1 Tax=Cellulomonas carbonis T26 TaxID=947969 RepID=A0A0A0BNW8_9CELL|nr:ABC transporter permease [Cellulomonas carbonis]KGM09645.1 ABC transporter permease [Cellulomonas carbonis T26]GGC07061.1 ABC transporter permease [Cellulomonas carbonis]
MNALGTTTGGVAGDGVSPDLGSRTPNPLRTVGTIAALTLREASRRRVLLALAALTVVLLALSAWGFSRLAAEAGPDTLTSGEARLTASIMLNLVMFGFSLIAALGTAFLAGPTLAGETESGIALSVLARPVRRWAFLLGKWLGLVGFGSGFVVVAGLAQCLVVQATVGYWPPRPAVALALLAAQTVALLTLALLLSTLVSPMASGVVAVGLFGATWIAGVVAGIGESLGNDAVARVGPISRMLLPTDGLWRGAMHAFQDPSAFLRLGGEEAAAFPFLGAAPLTWTYLVWAAVWVAMIWALAAVSFGRRDL